MNDWKANRYELGETARPPEGPIRPAGPADDGADDGVVTIDRFVPHTSTVHANRGERVGLFLHEN